MNHKLRLSGNDLICHKDLVEKIDFTFKTESHRNCNDCNGLMRITIIYP